MNWHEELGLAPVKDVVGMSYEGDPIPGLKPRIAWVLNKLLTDGYVSHERVYEHYDPFTLQKESTLRVYVSIIRSMFRDMGIPAGVKFDKYSQVYRIYKRKID